MLPGCTAVSPGSAQAPRLTLTPLSFPLRPACLQCGRCPGGPRGLPAPSARHKGHCAWRIPPARQGLPGRHRCRAAPAQGWHGRARARLQGLGARLLGLGAVGLLGQLAVHAGHLQRAQAQDVAQLAQPRELARVALHDHCAPPGRAQAAAAAAAPAGVVPRPAGSALGEWTARRRRQDAAAHPRVAGQASLSGALAGLILARICRDAPEAREPGRYAGGGQWAQAHGHGGRALGRGALEEPMGSATTSPDMQ